MTGKTLLTLTLPGFLLTRHVGSVIRSSPAEARLKYYLKDAKIDEGETLHGVLSGFASTLALSGSQLADVFF